MAKVEHIEQSSRIAATAQRLRVDAATAEVLRAFDSGGVESRLLKGPALAAWYADESARSYLDCDLWVRPAHSADAAATIAGLGFEPPAHENNLPEWWLEHASAWIRQSDGVVVDLHRTLQGVGVDPESAWEALSVDANAVLVAGYPVASLSVPACALYVTLHAAHHGRGWWKAIAHVERALDAVDEAAWREAARLAQQVDAEDAFAAGLRLTAPGTEVADRLGLGAPRSVKVALQANVAPPVALGIEQVASADGAWSRGWILMRKVVPPPDFIRHWWPPAARGRLMLAIGYLYRPVWLVRKAPAGFRAWRDARRQVRDR